MPQCRHNAAQNLVFRVESGILIRTEKKKMKRAISSQKKTRTATTVLSGLHVGSCHAAELLLKDGEHVPQSGGESLGVQHANRAAALQNGGAIK